MIKVLSYPIEPNSANWPGNPDFSVKQNTGIEQGDSCNTFTVSLFNHYGTHFDAPNHFNKDGLKIAELPFDTFIYEMPLLLEIPKKRDEKIMAEDLRPHMEAIAKCDLLLLRTGWSKIRESFRDLYCCHGPAVSAEAAKFLMDNFGKTLKAVAMDFLSLAAPTDTVDGDEAHRYLLGVHHPGEFICIIEDCDLSLLNGNEKKIYAIPLRMTGVDSSPVTMFAETE